MKTEILINVSVDQTRVAYVEDGELLDLKIERILSPTLVGSIFVGDIARILPGMQAAFVDVGLSKAGFLYVGDIGENTDGSSPELIQFDEVNTAGSENLYETDYESNAVQEHGPAQRPSIQNLIQKNQKILVQIAKDPIGTKGARLTTHISLPGRLVVYMPTVTHIGFSRKIVDQEERSRLNQMIKELAPEGGLIFRTAAAGCRVEELHEDLELLKKIWGEISKKFSQDRSTRLLHSEIAMELRSLRDLLNDNVHTVVVDEAKTFEKVCRFTRQFMPKYVDRISLYQLPEPLFDKYEIDLEISRSLGRKFWLKSGGYIVIDEAEALVVVDVNTGAYVGKKDLEETIVKTNLEAIKEICHQLRVRDCGGIIIIDFIDMEKQMHREKIIETLVMELKKDRTRTEVMSMSELGLVEMTRKRIRPSLISMLCEPCPNCEGKGYVKRKNTIVYEIFHSIQKEIAHKGQNMTSVVVQCHAEVADWVYEEQLALLEQMEKKLTLSIVFKIAPKYHLEQYDISVSLDQRI